MNWIALTTEAQTDQIKEESKHHPVVIFKHSTRCSISNMAENRLKNLKDIGDATFYYLDLLQYRPISNKIAEDFKVHHESPQVLVIANGECVYDETHNGITVSELEEEVINARNACKN